MLEPFGLTVFHLKTVFLFNMTKKQTIALVVNGATFNFSGQVKKSDFVIATDGGANHCACFNIWPDVIIGDFDSIRPRARQKFKSIKQVKLPDQNETDLQKALKYIDKNFDAGATINIFCAFSRQIDYSLFNLLAVWQNRWREKQTVKFFGDGFTAEIISGQKILNGFKGRKISILPLFTPIESLTTKGFKWNLDREQSGFSLSNIVSGQRAKIEIVTGKMLLIIYN